MSLGLFRSPCGEELRRRGPAGGGFSRGDLAVADSAAWRLAAGSNDGSLTLARMVRELRDLPWMIGDRPNRVVRRSLRCATRVSPLLVVSPTHTAVGGPPPATTHVGATYPALHHELRPATATPVNATMPATPPASMAASTW